LIDSFSIAGYRSFGGKHQRFEKLSKVNLLIGQNNSGKSNILRFLHDIYPQLSELERGGLNLHALDRHLPSGHPFSTGLFVSLTQNYLHEFENFNQQVVQKFKEHARRTQAPGYALRVYEKKAKLDGSEGAWFDFGADRLLITNDWVTAFSILEDREIQNLWQGLTGKGGGSRNDHWFPESLKRLTPSFPNVRVVLIPAIRKMAQ